MAGRFTQGDGQHPTTAATDAAVAAAFARDEPARLLPAILDGMGDGLLVADEQGRFLFFNAAARRILGAGPADVPLDDWPLLYGLYRPDTGALFEACDLPFVRALRGEACDQVEVLVRNALAPAAILLSVTCRPLAGAGGPRGVVMVLRDVTARLRAEEEMRRSRERFALAVQGSTDGLWDWDVARAEVYYSPRWKEMLGYGDDEIGGRFEEWSGRLHPEDRQRALQTVDDYLNGRIGDYALEHRLRHKDGSYRWILARGVAVRDAAGRISRMAGSHTDVTIRRQEEEELRRARDAAEQANRAKNQFLATMSHELRTPLHVILGLTALTLDQPVTPEQRGHLHLVQSSTHALLAVIDDVLDFARMESGRLDLAPREFALADALGDTLQMLAPSAHAKGLELAYRVDAAVPDQLVGDWDRLRQVVAHLVGNAVKFTERGEVVVTVRVADEETGRQGDRETRREEGSDSPCLPVSLSPCLLVFAVRDTGVGVPPEKQRLIFDPFVQADGSMRREYGGVGLGLALSARVVAAMGGRLWVEGAPGGGSVFQFLVPLAAAAGASAAAVPTKPVKPSELYTTLGSGGGPAPEPTPRLDRPLRVLIVEDLPINQKLSAALVRKLGGSPVLAAGGAEALAALRRETFDAVLMDLQMPGMDGFETTAHIRAAEARDGRRLPIIALTAHAMQGDRERCLAAGMDGYLAKPVNGHDLYLALTAATAGAPPPAPTPPAEIAVTESHPPSSAFRREVALARVGGDEDLLRELTADYLRDAPTWRNDLRQAVAGGDAAAVRIAAHTIKGAVGYFGADEAGALADRLQELGRGGDVAAAAVVLPQLEQALDRLGEALRALDPGPTPSLENLP